MSRPRDPRRLPPDLQIDVAFLVAEGDQEGACPVGLPDGDVFVYLRSGRMEVSVDAESWELRTGDTLDAAAPQRASRRATLTPRVVTLTAWGTY
jgi:hypothetical protein